MFNAFLWLMKKNKQICLTYLEVLLKIVELLSVMSNKDTNVIGF